MENDNLAAQMRAYLDEFLFCNPQFSLCKLKDCCSMQYGYTETATTEPVGVKFLRITDIAQPSINWKSVPHCPITKENHAKYVLSEGDVVVARTGATVGVAKMLGRNIPDSVFASFLVRIRPKDENFKFYIGLCITSSVFLEFVQNIILEQPQANPPLLGAFELPIPDSRSVVDFNKKVIPFLNAIEDNEAEISTLTELKSAMIEMLSSR